MPLRPAAGSLGLSAPFLGPWFSNDVALDAPRDDDLSVEVSSSAGDWLPPAAGTLSMVLPATINRGETLYHRQLAGCRNASGAPLFPNDDAGHMVALFTLLPEVYVRLEQMYRATDVLSLADGGTRSALRPVPRQWALVFETPADENGILALVAPPAALLGELGLTSVDGALRNATRPMAWLRRPSQVAGAAREPLVTIPDASRLYVFDAEGMPLDPGAVVSAFNALVRQFDDIKPDAGPFPATGSARRVHLIGPAGEEVEPALLDGITGGAGTGSLRTFDGALSLGLSADLSSARPCVRLGLLPGGSCGVSVSRIDDLLLPRDFMQVLVIDVELALTGRRRTDDDDWPHQARTTTRVDLARSTASPTLLPNHEAFLETLSAMLDADDPITLVASEISGANGPLAPPPGLVDAPVPEDIEESALALYPVRGGRGAGTTAEWARGMQAVAQVTLPADRAGCWVRLMPLDFDTETGERSRMAGGAGLAIATGVGDSAAAVARILLTLPDGPVPASDPPPDDFDPVAFDIDLVTQQGRRLFGSRLRPRIAPPPEFPGAVVIAADGAFPADVDSIYVCETGQRLARGDALAPPAGLSLVAELAGGGFALVDATGAPYAAFPAGIGRRLASGDALVTTTRVWRSDPSGDSTDRLSATGAVVQHGARDPNPIHLAGDPGAPLPMQERAEVLAAAVADGRAEAVIGAISPLDRFHEFHPGRLGRAGEPATSEVHATGVHLSGPAAVLAHEVARERLHASTEDLLQTVTAAPPGAPAEPGAPGPVVALLRTVSAGVEGETQIHFASAIPPLPSPFPAMEYPLNGSVEEKALWYAALLVNFDLPVPPDAGAQGRFSRAADRRAFAAINGLTEAVAAALRLIRHAQRFIYIEAPAFDAGIEITADGAELEPNTGNDRINLVAALRQRLTENPNLHALICVPAPVRHAFPAMERLRNHNRQRAIDALRGPAEPSTSPWSPSRAQRVVVFSPLVSGDRPLQVRSGTIIVDDLVAVTGSFSFTRRGLTFDSSLAAAVFDERMVGGKSREVIEFRQKLIADRLGETIGAIPYDGAVLTRLVGEIVRTRVNSRIAPPSTVTSDPPTNFAAVLDPDGRPSVGFDIMSYLTLNILGVDLADSLTRELAS